MSVTVIPDVLTFTRATAGLRQAPIVLDSPHSGTIFPEDFGTEVPIASLRRVQDSFVDELFANAPDNGASLLTALFPRSYVDPNRAETDIDIRMIDGQWNRPVVPTEKTRLGHGLIWKTCPAERAMYSSRLPVELIERRIECYWRPYHEALEGEIDRLHRDFGIVFHLNCHSMPSGSSPVISRKNGIRRADFVLGDQDGKTCDPAFTMFVRDWLEAAGYVVRLNDPYKGAELVSRYAAPEAGRHSLQIEINRGLYMEETSLRMTRGFSELKQNLTGLVDALADFSDRFALPAAAE